MHKIGESNFVEIDHEVWGLKHDIYRNIGRLNVCIGTPQACH